MSYETKAQAGAQLRQLRRHKSRIDGRAWTMQDLADAARVSVKTIQRAENGTASPGVLKSIFEVLELGYEERTVLADAFNPLRLEGGRLSEDERLEIRKTIKELMLAVEPLPSYVMDEYWFIRAINVHMLALHSITPAMLKLPAAWHTIAMKFEPEIDLRTIRGPHWRDYYWVALRGFQGALKGVDWTERYKYLMEWLNGLGGFNRFWNRAMQQDETRYRMALQKTTHIPVYHTSGTQWWNEVGGEFFPSLQLPDGLAACGFLKVRPGARIQMPQTLTRLSLDKAAERLGYDVRKRPVLFIEEYLSWFELREIGGWID